VSVRMCQYLKTFFEEKMTVDILYKMTKGEMSVDQMPVDDLSAKEMSPCHCRSFSTVKLWHYICNQLVQV